MIIIINESVVGLNRFSKKKVPHPHVTSCSYPQSLNNIFSKYYMSCHGHMRHSWVLMGASQEKTFEERDLPVSFWHGKIESNPKKCNLIQCGRLLCCEGFHPSVNYIENISNNRVGVYCAWCRSLGVTGLFVIVMNPGIAPAPPATWATEQYGIENPEYYSEIRVGRVADAYDAWKHCKDVTREDVRPPDLYDLLSHSVGETQYAFPPKGVCVCNLFVVSIWWNSGLELWRIAWCACVLTLISFCYSGQLKCALSPRW